MADAADIANAYIAKAIELELHNRKQQNIETQKGAKTCKDCGEVIPMERRRLGFQLCIECAEEIERRKALFANN